MSRNYELSEEQIQTLVDRYEMKATGESVLDMVRWAKEVHGIPMRCANSLLSDLDSVRNKKTYHQTVPFIELVCPHCGSKQFKIVKEATVFLLSKSFTFDCDNRFCAKELIYVDYWVHDLDKYVESKRPSSSEDGDGTGVIELGLDPEVTDWEVRLISTAKVVDFPLVIKALRERTILYLRECRNLVTRCPSVLGVFSKDEADSLAQALRDLGCEVEVTNTTEGV